MADENCGGCKFWMPLEQDDQGSPTIGACRRYPPTIMYQPIPVQKVVGSAPVIDWSKQASTCVQTRPSAWCGEFVVAPPRLAIERH